MTDITTTTQQAYARPVQKFERQAQAIDELRQLHTEYEDMRRQLDEQQRLIVHLNDRNQLLQQQLQTSLQTERVVTRKLMRLAQSVSNIGKLTEEADSIVKSSQEHEEEIERQIAEQSQQNEENAAAAELAGRIGALPPTWQTN